MARRRGRALVAVPGSRAALLIAVALVLTVIAAGCGRDDFENDPRPPVPAEVTVKIGNGEVAVSPVEFGAGPTNFEIANFYDIATVLRIDGPSNVESDEVPARGNTSLKTDLESGEYVARVDAVGAKPFRFTVGPERESGQNDLLLP
jgi:hypothetical protein